MTYVVVSRLMCGLGNQLFQYAAACGVAHAGGNEVVLDATEFASGMQERPYLLDRYNLGVPVITQSAFDSKFRTVQVPMQEALFSLGRKSTITVPVYRQDHFEFEPAIKSLKGDAYLYGFWQSWKYFADIADIIRSRLTIAPRSGAETTGVMQAIAESQSVAVHVRRGDYVTPYNQNIFGLCQTGYYAGAMTLVRERIRNPRFFVFSDDPDWCKAGFKAPDTTVVSVAGGDARDDLALMARCRHHVIANSSLSWWGAWLGEKPTSIVVAPMPWYTRSPRALDLVPDHWIRLDRRSGNGWSAQRQRLASPGITAIILGRHGPLALRKAINSVFAQSYPDLDTIIALCDASTETIAAAEELATLNDRVQLICASHASPGAALAAAVSQARGEWVAFLDDRDRWMPGKLEVQLEAAQLAGVGLVSCRVEPVDGPQGKPAIFPPPGPPSTSMVKLCKAGYFVSGISHVLAKRQVVHDAAPFDDRWSPEKGNDAWRRLLSDEHIVMLWERLVESPIPYLSGP
jgi:Glycosyl transferase family 11/Glycosyl transferase family 2